MKNRDYKIKLTAHNYSMVIIDKATNEIITEYRIDSPSNALNEIRALYKSIDNHLTNPGATLYNYQW